MHNYFWIKSVIFTIVLLVDAMITQRLYDYLFKGIERAFFNSDIDHLLFQHKVKNVAYFCTSIFLIILIFTFFILSQL
jgi:hypothetical protein